MTSPPPPSVKYQQMADLYAVGTSEYGSEAAAVVGLAIWWLGGWCRVKVHTWFNPE